MTEATENGATAKRGVAFYCVADARYFPGAVALVNSLRLLGHDEPIRLLDCGLSAAQREWLRPQAELIGHSGDTPPWLLKTVAPLRVPAETMVLLDTDLVVTRRLYPLTESASGGRLVAFRNPRDRFDPRWGELLDLGEIRRGPYLSSAAIVVDRELGERVLGLMDDRQRHVDFEQTHWRQNTDGYAFEYADQDVFNAILSTVVDPERVVALDSRLAPTPPFEGLRLRDEALLRCAYDDGEAPYLVHHHVIKPWLEPTHHGVYSRLLRRLLIGDDLAVRVPAELVPAHLRRGARAWAMRARVNARERVRWHVSEPLRQRRRARR